MEVVIKYEKEDWRKFQQFLGKEIPKRIKTPLDNFFVNLVVWMVIGIVSMFIFRNIGEFHGPTAAYVMAFAVVIFILFIMRLNKYKNAFAPSEGGCFIGTHTFTINESGIETKGHGYSGSYSWSTVIDVVRSNGLIMLFLDTANAFIFPESKIEDPEALYKYIKECNNTPNKDTQ